MGWVWITPTRWCTRRRSAHRNCMKRLPLGRRRAAREGQHMRTYLFSLGAGMLVGMIYALIDVRSPAPPLVALVGLLGILVGEQVIPVGKQVLSGSTFPVAWQDSKCTSHVFGMLPGRHADEAQTFKAKSSENSS